MCILLFDPSIENLVTIIVDEFCVNSFIKTAILQTIPDKILS